MDETKAWYSSKAIWASVLQVVVGVAVAAGWLDQSQGDIVQGEFPELLAGLAVAGLGIFGAVGRIVATKQLTL